jgi:hypothetical protein
MNFTDDDIIFYTQMFKYNEKLLNKHAQETVPANDVYNAANILVLNLQKELHLNQEDEPANLLGAATANVVATADNFKSLTDLIVWIVENKLTWRNSRFAWSNTENVSTSNDIWEFKSPSSTFEAFVDIKLLTEYLSFLRDNEKNNITRMLVAKLIAQFNTFISTTKQSIDTVSSDKPAQAFENNDVIDGFSKNVLDPKDPYININNLPFFERSLVYLRVSDIKTSANFINWINQFSIIIDSKAVPVNNPASDARCIIANILVKRAKYLKSQAAVGDRSKSNYSALTKYYLDRITELTPLLTDKEGVSCSVYIGKETQAPGPNVANAPAITPQNISQLIESLPLANDAIDLQAIKNFLNVYKIMNPHINLLIARNNQLQTEIISLLKPEFSSNPVFNIRASADSINRLLQSNNVYKLFLEKLLDLLVVVESVLMDIRTRFITTKLINQSSAKSLINAQINIILPENRRQILYLKSKVPVPVRR